MVVGRRELDEANNCRTLPPETAVLTRAMLRLQSQARVHLERVLLDCTVMPQLRYSRRGSTAVEVECRLRVGQQGEMRLPREERTLSLRLLHQWRRNLEGPARNQKNCFRFFRSLPRSAYIASLLKSGLLKNTIQCAGCQFVARFTCRGDSAPWMTIIANPLLTGILTRTSSAIEIHP